MLIFIREWITYSWCW